MATPKPREGQSSTLSSVDHERPPSNFDTTNLTPLSQCRTPSVSSISNHSHPDVDCPPSTARSPNEKRGWAHFDVRQGIYRKTPFWMVTLFLIGLCSAVGHHIFYITLDGDQVGTQTQQEWNLRFGSTLAHVTQISLVASVGVAYTQWLWRTLSTKALTVECIDAAFDADQAIISLLNREFVRKVHVGACLAILCWALQLPSLVTPATLNVQSTLKNTTVMANVSSLDMTGNQWKRFAISFNGTDDSHLRFAGPRTVIQRLVTATATGGIILPIVPPFLNSSYQLNITGPAVRCGPAPKSVEYIIDKLRLEAEAAIFEERNLKGQPLNHRYYGFVPSFSNTSSLEANVTAIDVNRVQAHGVGSNYLWMTYENYRWGSNQTIENYTACTLHSAVYTVDFNFTQNFQNITNVSETLLDEIAYPQRNETQTPELEMKHAYSAVMWAISDLLIGKMTIFNTSDSDQLKLNEINTQIARTNLVGSSDLRVFFDQNRKGSTNTPSNQTQEDIRLARGRTLIELIQELAFNVTISFMNSPLLSPRILTRVANSQSIITYNYSSRNLFIAYGLAILASFTANILGLYAMRLNNASHTRTFSARVITRRGLRFVDLVNRQGERWLTTPLGSDIMTMRLRFDVKTWGFVVVGKGGDECTV